MADSVLAPDQPALEAFDAFNWSGATEPPVQPAPQAGALDPDMAVRARLGAILIDGIIVGIPTAILTAALGSTARSPDTLLLFLGLQFFYFFAFELSRGQTIGKRQYHLHVVSCDGSPLTSRQVATRNLLRFIDALPIMYASGLISMMRTGRKRRQRIGDVAAGTMVVLDADGRQLRTPRWLLPLATLLAVAFSIGIIVAIADAHPTRPQFPALIGFPGSYNRQAPQSGAWQATGATSWTAGYLGEYAGRQHTESWTIRHACASSSLGSCSFVLTRNIQGIAPASAPLVEAQDGWHATFVLGVFPCESRDGTTAGWQQSSTMILTFADGGQLAQAHEQNESYSAACGYGADGVSWTAQPAPR